MGVSEAAQNQNPARIKVFWQPGCTSCLRVKEFLTSQGVEFESIDVHNDADGIQQLNALGARSVPIVALGGRYTLAQSLNDVIRFLDLNTRTMEALPPEKLVGKLELVLTAAARLTRQLSEDQLRSVFRNRQRTVGALVFHIVRVAQMGLQATQQIELRFESFDDLPPDDWRGNDLVGWGEEIREQLHAWWRNESDRTLDYSVPTYYGRRPMHEVLERTTWHAAQHTRQLALILESHGIEPDEPLTPVDLAGLPVPEEVWDR
jgi:glutaredoxin